MARSRLIKPGFATNEFLSTRSHAARLLFAMLPTIADRDGRLEDRPRKIKANLFPYEQIDVDALLSELANCDDPEQDHPFLIRYSVDDRKFIQIVKFAENQNPHRDEKPSLIPLCDHDASTVQPPCKDDAPPVRSTKQASGTKLKVQVTSNKVKETSSKREKLDLPDDIATSDLRDAVDDWLAYKTERKESYKPTGLKQFITRIGNLARERGSPHVAEKLRRAMVQNWKGWDFENGDKNGKRKDTGAPSQTAGRGSLSV